MTCAVLKLYWNSLAPLKAMVADDDGFNTSNTSPLLRLYRTRANPDLITSPHELKCNLRLKRTLGKRHIFKNRRRLGRKLADFEKDIILVLQCQNHSSTGKAFTLNKICCSYSICLMMAIFRAFLMQNGECLATQKKTKRYDTHACGQTANTRLL